MIKAVFLGTAGFAADILQALIDSPEINVGLVITQPDKPVGRRQEMQKSQVKMLAEKNNIPVLQPASLKRDFDADILKEYDLGITCQYGLIIPETVINAPRHQTINIHPSLLPKYRGASPMQSALINGEAATGISIMLIDKELDHGPILAQEKITIAPHDTIKDLEQNILPLAKTLTIQTATNWVHGKIKPGTQDHTQATACTMFNKADGQVDFIKDTAQEIYNKYRGFLIWPGIWSLLLDKRIKLLDIKPADKKLNPGEILPEGQNLFIGTKSGSLQILKLQVEGKKPMADKDFINGYLKP